MANVTISSTVDFKIAEKLEYDAITNNTTISHIIRNIIIENYKSKEKNIQSYEELNNQPNESK